MPSEPELTGEGPLTHDFCHEREPMNNISRDYNIEVPGLPPELQSTAKEDIGRLLDAITRVAGKQGTRFLLDKVRITDRFEDDVNRLLNERSGLTGYVAARRNAHAIAKTLWARSKQGDLGFVVIIDASQIGPWALSNARCLTTALHELVHVLREERHLERPGEEEYTADGDTRERRLDGWACLLLDEFDVDRLVDAMVGGLAKKEDGQSWSLRELDEAQGLDWVHVLLDTLNRLPRFVDDEVCKFRTWQIGIDDLDAAVIPYVKDLLRLLSHTAARYMGTDLWPDIVERIKETDASQRFLKEHLDTILAHFDDAHSPLEESIQAVGQAVEGIFRNCGLGFWTVPEGVYIEVTEPSA